MKGKKVGSYTSKNGNKVFRYAVTGTEKEIADYKKAQGEFLRETEDGQPLFFSTRFVGNNPTLIITAKGKVIADMSKYDEAASLSAQYGGNFGQELARKAAESLMGDSDTVVSTPVASAEKIDQH